MNNLKSILAIIVSILAIAVGVQGQTTNQTPQGTFFGSVKTYFTSFDTNSTTFGTNSTFDVWAGADYQNNLNFANSIGIEYKVGSLLSLESVTRNAGIAGTILSQQVGLGLNKTVYDTKLTGFIDGAYDFQLGRPYISPGLRVKKALTDHTFAGIGIEVPFYFKGGSSGRQVNPVVTLFTGFVF